MKKLLASAAVAMTLLAQTAFATCDIRIENHADNSIAMASLFVLNYGSADLDYFNISPKGYVCFNRSEYINKKWVVDKNSVLNHGRVILHLEGALSKYLDHTYTAHIARNHVLKVYNDRIVNN